STVDLRLPCCRRPSATEYVPACPPLGPVAPRAHDMVREYHVLRAVHPRFPQAPRVHVLCEDLAVLGAPFFIMERRRGVILREEIPAEFAAIDAHPRMIGEAFLDALVSLHKVDVTAPGIRELGKPEGYV